MFESLADIHIEQCVIALYLGLELYGLGLEPYGVGIGLESCGLGLGLYLDSVVMASNPLVLTTTLTLT